MKTFDEVMAFTRTVSSNAAYEDAECCALWDALRHLEPHSTVVEIGVECGRSTSVIAQVAMEQCFNLHLVDPFLTYGGRPLQEFLDWMRPLGCPFTLHVMKTEDAASRLPEWFHFLHIDGDHSTEGVTTDCERLLPTLLPGGILAVHDYGRDSLPTVKPVIDKYVRGWEMLKHVGSLGVWRKP